MASIGLKTRGGGACRRLARYRVLTLALAAMAVAATPARADVKAGVDAWSRGDHAGAVKEWLGPAARGDADAQFNMGQAYKLGKGVTQDLKRAEAWYRKAAEQGHIKAGDTLGLLLFQENRKAEALPYLTASAYRGEPRAMYILGIAHFNGDTVGKDWVRAYALMSRSAATGLDQATRGLATMDEIIPLDQRQLAMSLATELEQKAQANRAREFAAADLGVKAGAPAPMRPQQAPAPLQRAELPPSTPSVAAPVTAGADFADPVPIPTPRRVAASQAKPDAPREAAPPAARAKPAAPTQPRKAAPSASAPKADGNWRIQFGAFGVKSNADALWAKVRNRAEVAGHARIDLPAGGVSRLLAGGYTESQADKACAALKAGGFSCLVVKP
ncbi:Sel1 repeat-containing protein [Novosphingobium aromaticivorans]|nr:Sel1 repeat-containing protein [Novosphingobium aromaticivorans]